MASASSRASSASPSSAQTPSSSTAPGSAQSPSSSTARRWEYDVFLSFRGPDTRRSIAYSLYNRLQKRGIQPFMDDEDLEVGDPISPTLLKAIEESRFAIVILSPNYASSTWCLEELAKICECMKENNRILPLFYNVEPSDVRYRKRSFGEAFEEHERSRRHTPDQVKQWRDALKKVADFSGWNTNNIRTDEELVEKIVDCMCEKLQPFDTESTVCNEDFEPYEATKKAMDEVMEALKDDNVTAVGVSGIGGVGKTTMVQEVAAQSKKSGIFSFVITLVVSQRPDLIQLQDKLAYVLGNELKEKIELEGKIESARAEILRKKMKKVMRSKNINILIVLDNVWEKIKLSEIGIPSYKELQECSSKVVLTTRKKKVINDMRCERGITLDLLSPEDSWSLFKRNASTGTSLDFMEFEELARRVAGECGGLPIALKAVASALKDENKEEWKRAAKRLKESQYANPNHKEDDENAVKCIRLSYDYLANEDQKSCFLLCCLFPEDFEIAIEDLIRYAVRTRLYRDAQTIEDARGDLVSIVKYLERSSLLSYSEKNGCVKMHDVIRDTAIRIAEFEEGFRVKVGFGLKGWPYGLDAACTIISLMRNEIRKLPDEELVCSHLQILLLNRNADLDEIPDEFVKSLSELRVLDISNTRISVLPQSFSLFLQALYLDDCNELIDISVVGKLEKLEILSIRGYPKGELPREIGHLTNLRILDVNRSVAQFNVGGMVTIPSKVISMLHKLEELYMVYCRFEDWGCEVEGRGEETSTGFDELVGLPYLKILQVGIPDVEYLPKNVETKPDWDYFCVSIMGRCRYILGSSRPTEVSPTYTLGDHYSRSLSLNGPTISILPDWFTKVITEKIEKLEYQCCGGMRDILMEHDHGRLHKLKYLLVRGFVNDYFTFLMKVLVNTTKRVQRGPVFEKLEELHLYELTELEELCVGELPPGSLLNLKVFTMTKCFSLKNVSKFVQRLPSLEKLHLKGMLKLEYVFGCEGPELKESKLREVHLFSLNSVKSICRGPAPRVVFQSIKILTIDHCPLLQSLFTTSYVAQCLSQLEDLYVKDCPLLERVIEAVNNEKAVLPKLKNIVLENLPVLYGASTVDIECPSLEHLLVLDCPNIKFSTSDSRIGFSSSASDYCFGSKNPVQLNDNLLYVNYNWGLISGAILDEPSFDISYLETSLCGSICGIGMSFNETL